VLFSRAQGPSSGTGSETVAKKKNPSTGGTVDTVSPAVTPAGPDGDLPKIPSQYKKDKEAPPPGTPHFETNASTVSVDVAVMDSKNHFIPKIPRGNFRILEDNVPQQLTSYSVGEAPMTICLLIEFSNRFQSFYSPTWFQTIQASYDFAQSLKPEDNLAIVAYDLRPEMLSDFTTDRQQTFDALQRLRFAGFSESNMFDALVDTAQRMQDIEGRKAIVLVASGVDTFSQLTFDKTRRALQEAGVPVYTFGLMQNIRDIMMSMRINPIAESDWLQADNQMRTFATETGGMAFFPHFDGEFQGIFKAISQNLRQEYTLTYVPSNQAHDGKFRKIKVELVNPATNQPLPIKDEKGKAIKYSIIAKPGYTAPRAVE
jgi:VWFA-related protein